MSGARDIAVSIVRALRGAGRVAYFAGGCVRDELLGLTPEDYDVATDATPDQVRAVGKKAGWTVNEVGVSFGVLLVTPRAQPGPGRHTVEVATFREESAYSDRRRPDAVTFSDAQSDARRRDFTINALFLDPLADDQGCPPGDPGGERSPLGGRMIDFVGGVADLRARLVRAVGDPDARLDEDNLRALRAVRLASRLGFAIDPPTADAMRSHAGALAGVSRERIGEELRRMLAHPSRALAAARLQELALDAPTLTEQSMRPMLPTLGGLPHGASCTTALAAWAIDRLGAGASPDAIERETRPIVSRWRGALCLSNDESDALRDALLGAARLARDWPSLPVAKRKRIASGHAFTPALELLGAGQPAAAQAVTDAVRALAATPGGLAPPPLITGDELLAIGLPPGPAFRAWLDETYDAQLEGRLVTREEALAYARGLASTGG